MGATTSSLYCCNSVQQCNHSNFRFLATKIRKREEEGEKRGQDGKALWLTDLTPAAGGRRCSFRSWQPYVDFYLPPPTWKSLCSFEPKNCLKIGQRDEKRKKIAECVCIQALVGILGKENLTNESTVPISPFPEECSDCMPVLTCSPPQSVLSWAFQTHFRMRQSKFISGVWCTSQCLWRRRGTFEFYLFGHIHMLSV